MGPRIKLLFFSLTSICMTGCAVPVSLPYSPPKTATPASLLPHRAANTSKHPSIYTKQPYQNWSAGQVVQEPHSSQWEYVEQHWVKTRSNGKKDVLSCIQRSENHINIMEKASQWVYVNGSYQRETASLKHADSCWSSLKDEFRRDHTTTSHEVGDNPLTHYYSALAQWAGYCQEVALNKAGLNHCLSKKAMESVELARQALHEYIHNGS